MKCYKKRNSLKKDEGVPLLNGSSLTFEDASNTILTLVISLFLRTTARCGK